MLKAILIWLILSVSSIVYADDLDDQMYYFQKQKIQRNINDYAESIENTQKRMETTDDSFTYDMLQQQQKSNIQNLNDEIDRLDRLNKYGW